MADNDDSLIGIFIEIAVGAIVLGIEISFWLVWALCMVPAVLLEIFGGDAE